MKPFKQIVFMALRNLGRNKRRTLSTLMAVVIGLVGLICLDGYINYSMWGLQETIIHSGTGHFQVALNSSYFDEGDNDPFPYMIPKAKKLAKELRRIPEVKAVLPAVNFYGVLNVDGKMEMVHVQALPSDLQEDNLNFLTLKEGQFLSIENPGRILLGQGLAAKLGLKIGKNLSLFALSQGGGVNNQTYQIGGIVSSGISASDSSAVYMDLSDAQSLLQTQDVPQLIVFLEHTEDVPSVIHRLQAKPPVNAPAGVVYKSWNDLSPYFIQANTSYQMVLSVARIIVILVALFSISGTISLSVMERFREIGTLRAFGTKRYQVILMFVLEGLFMGLLGAIIGSLAGAGISEIFNLTGGVKMAAPGMSDPISILFRPKIENFLFNGALVAAVSILGSLIPGIYASRKNNAELLRHV